MATRTSVADGKWSVAGTWDTGVPADTDIVIIAAGTSVEFDVDQTAFAAGVDVTINGTLYASTTAGSYVLKLSANMDGAGTLRAGTSTVAYPQTCTFEIMRGGFEITATNLTLDINCAEPTYTVIKCTGAEAAGQTVLEVDTDVTADIWAAGNIVRVDDINGQNSEERIIAAGGIAAGAITITAGLTNAKVAGAFVMLITRNVRITHTAAAGNAINAGNNGRIGAMIYKCTYGVNQGSGHTISGTVSGCVIGVYYGSGHTISGTVSGCSYGVYQGSGHTISGTVSGCVNGVDSGSGHTISGTVSGCSNGVVYGSGHTISGTVSGCTYGVYYGSGHTISGTVSGCSNGVVYGSGHTISGTVSGCVNGVNQGSGHTISGTVSGCVIGVYYGSGILLGATFTGNTTRDIYFGSGPWRGYGTSLNSATQVTYNADLPTIGWQQIAIWDIGGVAGAYKSWMRGGRVQSQAVIVPSGRTVAYQHICESVDFPVFMDRFAELEPGATITITAYLRKDAAMAYLPRVQLFRIEEDPLWIGPTLDAATMTDSIDTWETLSLEWTNSTVGPVTVVVRTLAQNASGNVYADSLIINGGGSTGGGGGARWISGEAIGYIG